MDTKEFTLELNRESGYRFEVEFDQARMPVLHVDEAQPVGEGSGPNPARLLAAAIGHCLASSLLFCLQRSRVEVQGMNVAVSGTILRNEAGRLRVDSVRVKLRPGIAEQDRERIDRCLQIFEDFCIVTQSVRLGIDVQVEVEPQLPA